MSSEDLYTSNVSFRLSLKALLNLPMTVCNDRIFFWRS